MFTNLSDWLAWQETLHPSAIDLSLDRIRKVLQRLRWQAPPVPVITVAGTKGKGSCAAMLESIYLAGGYRTGLFTSPHLQRYNERIRIAGADISDESLCAAFARIDAARGEISLTYFEFNTLAALLCFATAGLDVWLLEVGMGGRLDAVNAIDADVAVLTSIGLDHTEWLGNDVESIGREKAGIMRAGKPAVFGAQDMPDSIRTTANQIGATLLRTEHDFGFVRDAQTWTWWMDRQRLEHLPLPGIAGEVQLWNAAAALAALHLLTARLPLDRKAIEQGLRTVQLAGRFQVIPAATARCEWIFDVAHNPLSATVLAAHLAAHAQRCGRKRTVAIFGVLADKDLHGMVAALRAEVDSWIAVSLPGPRALPAATIAERLRGAGVKVIGAANDVPIACEMAARHVALSERVLVCGSFLAVGPALAWLQH